MMSVWKKLPLVALAGCLVSVSPAWGQKLDKEEKKWLDEVRPIMLPDEEKTFKDLKEKADRQELQKIFWARRNPQDPTAAENSFKTEYDKMRTEADTKFKVTGRIGSATDCGRVYLLLGAPDDIQKIGEPDTPGHRSPENWTYKDRPTMKFKDGQVQIGFDADCQLPQGARMAEQLNRLAQGKIVNPTIAYPKDKNGRLVKLVDQLPKPSPARSLLMEPKQDFPLAAEPKLFLRSPGGEASYVAGLIQGKAPDLEGEDAGGKKLVRVALAVQAVDASGKPSLSTEREVLAEGGSDGSFVASYGMALKPGKYTLNVAAHNAKASKGSVTSMPLEVPDYANGEFALSPLLALHDIVEGQTASPQDAFFEFALGGTRLLPRFSNVFSQSESLTLLAVVYNSKVDETTGKPSITAGFVISREGKDVAKAEDQTYDSEMATPSVGPVPLAKYTAGKHVAKIKVKDNVSKKELVQEVAFEVR